MLNTLHNTVHKWFGCIDEGILVDEVILCVLSYLHKFIAIHR